MKRNTNSESQHLTVAKSGSRTSVVNPRNQASILTVYPENTGLEELMHILPFEQMRAKLSCRSVSSDPALWLAPREVRLDALRNFAQSYLPTTEAVHFAEVVYGGVRNHLASQEYEDPAFREWFYRVRDFLSGYAPELPRTSATGGPSCMAITGASQTGKTAFLQRIRLALGKPIALEGGDTSPSLRLVPVLSVFYPECNTVEGLLRNIRHALLTEVGGPNADQKRFPDFKGPKGADIAISLCVLLNVCLITIDGASARHATERSMEVVKFLLRLQSYAGMQVVVSGTPVFMDFIGRDGSLSANFFSGRQLSLDPIRPPETNPDGTVSKNGIWYQRNLWYWELGLFGRKDIHMPEMLPIWTYEYAHGREGWLAQGYAALHTALVNKPRLLEPGRLTQQDVAMAFQLQLRNQRSAIAVVHEIEAETPLIDDMDFYDYLDHFPSKFIGSSDIKSRLHGLRSRK
ncbi:P-loop NTPase family protein [Paraburkholderia bannensis]|uniref:hypothetical protein n=1 Tax=Paraburkholderia bannensis TaxID=765414 RepID=UPI002ABD65A4|nr:hypothetical protein [Paraburkholderia bannensis]